MMYLVFCLSILFCTTAKYQFLGEQDVIDVVTVSEEEATKLITEGSGPSYLMTKKRVKKSNWFMIRQTMF